MFFAYFRTFSAENHLILELDLFIFIVNDIFNKRIFLILDYFKMS